MNTTSNRLVSRRPTAIFLRFAVLLAIVIAATWGAHQVREALDFRILPEHEQDIHKAIMTGTVAFVGLLAIPFVPGAEIGLAMLTAFGTAIAPLVYVATVLALCLSYTIGRVLPMTALVRLLESIRMRRAADLVARMAPLSRDARLAMLLEGAPPRMVALALRRRYVALALALNVPGNALIGGGGGIALLAGLSGLFAPLPTVLAFAIAVSPIPLAIMVLGT